MATKKPETGINKAAFLVRHLFDPDKLESTPTRNGYGEGLVEAGKKNKQLMVLCADLTESTRTEAFKLAFPDRFVQMGVSEQSLASIAAGMALAGQIPFLTSYAAFSPGRNWEQIKTCGALQNANIKIAGAHAGASVGPDGATHQMLEDIALMRILPGIQVVVPCDAVETKKATLAIATHTGPDYLRFARAASPVFTTKNTPFKIGRAECFRHGSDLTLIGAGPLLYEALLAAQVLAHDHGIQARVLNMHTIKPLDVKAIVMAAKQTGAIVTIEEAQVAGGLAGAVAETLVLTTPVAMECIGAQDRFGESGEPRQVQDALGMTARSIVLAALRVHKRKRGERVSTLPEHTSEAQAHAKELAQETQKNSLARAPRKWGGKQADKTLKPKR